MVAINSESANEGREGSAWPELDFAAWRETCETLHLWTQIVGKVRLVQMPWLNHSWHVTFSVSPRGLTTGNIPYGSRSFRIEFDFIDHRLTIESSNGGRRAFALVPMSVAAFYRALMSDLVSLDLAVRIHTLPNEVATAVRFPDDEAHCHYDAGYAWRFWQVLLRSEKVFTRFRALFCGKCSPVQFFWGSFDLAVTRFSGRTAPLHPGGIPNLPDRVAQEAYSHEVSSAGFWPGGEALPMPVFYSYAYPAPAGFADARVFPAQASYSQNLGEFLLPYDAVRTAAAPEQVLMGFLQSTYEAAADLAGWPRSELEV